MQWMAASCSLKPAPTRNDEQVKQLSQEYSQRTDTTFSSGIPLYTDTERVAWHSRTGWIAYYGNSVQRNSLFLGGSPCMIDTDKLKICCKLFIVFLKYYSYNCDMWLCVFHIFGLYVVQIPSSHCMFHLLIGGYWFTYYDNSSILCSALKNGIWIL